MTISDFNEYGQLIYTLQNKYSVIERSTLVLAPIGRTLARLEGEIIFEQGYVLDVWELIDFESGRIQNYSYEIYRAGDKMAWYDPFAHPHIPELASTHPHHKHIHPNIKQNRIPAPGISFTRPNLPKLIEEIEAELRELATE